MTKISWWLVLGRVRFAEAFDRSNLIFTHRAGRSALPDGLGLSCRRRGDGVTLTLRIGTIPSSAPRPSASRAAGATATRGRRFEAYASTFEGVGNGTGTTSDLRVRKCGVQEEVDGPFRPTLYISPALDAAETHHVPPSFTMAPFCEEPRFTEWRFQSAGFWIHARRWLHPLALGRG